eukprot:g5592.t1
MKKKKRRAKRSKKAGISPLESGGWFAVRPKKSASARHKQGALVYRIPVKEEILRRAENVLKKYADEPRTMRSLQFKEPSNLNKRRKELDVFNDEEPAVIETSDVETEDSRQLPQEDEQLTQEKQQLPLVSFNSKEKEVQAERLRRKKKIKKFCRTDNIVTRRLRDKLRAASYTHRGQDWEKLFAHYDRDNDGSLSLKEFISAVRRDAKVSKTKTADSELELIFHAVDENGDGKLTSDEFISWLEKDSLSIRKGRSGLLYSRPKRATSSRTRTSTISKSNTRIGRLLAGSFIDGISKAAQENKKLKVSKQRRIMTQEEENRYRLIFGHRTGAQKQKFDDTIKYMELLKIHENRVREWAPLKQPEFSKRGQYAERHKTVLQRFDYGIAQLDRFNRSIDSGQFDHNSNLPA